ncbi:hypothetical protein [Microcella sp.]|uniref:hypothetical protein n=1 Tax=Microcella sp. TaxID=1913979 RepID=UPI003F70E064
MYGFKGQLDWAVFEGRSVEAVCFSETTVRIAFSDRLAVTIQDAAILKLRSGDEETVRALDKSSLPTLVGETVELVEWDEILLKLTLQSGASLLLSDTSRVFESFTIELAGNEHYV